MELYRHNIVWCKEPLICRNERWTLLVIIADFLSDPIGRTRLTTSWSCCKHEVTSRLGKISNSLFLVGDTVIHSKWIVHRFSPLEIEIVSDDIDFDVTSTPFNPLDTRRVAFVHIMLKTK